MTTARVQRYRLRFYNRFNGWVDSHTQFAMFIRKRLREDMKILDLGAGRGVDGRVKFRGLAASVVGVDLDLAVRENRHLDAAAVGSADALPFAASSFDLVYSDWVMEHLPAPDKVVAEVFRVLRPGGLFIFRTGNLFHYVYAIAAVTPHWFHRLVANRVRGVFDDEESVHETYYRLNTRRAVRRCFAAAGFKEHELVMVEPEPAYLAFSVPTFLLGVAYERILNSAAFLSGMRANMLGCFEKPKMLQSGRPSRELETGETAVREGRSLSPNGAVTGAGSQIGNRAAARLGQGDGAGVGKPGVSVHRT